MMAGLIHACLSFTPVRSGTAFAAQDLPAGCSQGYMDRIPEEPELFIGCGIEIRGVLEAGETGSDYFIREASNRRLKVRPWAPVDSELHRWNNPPGAMSSFIGRQLRLVGQLVEEPGEAAVLEVSSVEDMDAPRDED